MSAAKKPFSFLMMLGTLAAVGGIMVLAVQFYRRPWQTVKGALRLGLLAIGAREDTIDAGGLPIHYYCAGQKNDAATPIILVHGLGGSAEEWLALIPNLRKGQMVYAFDLPGFGRSPQAPEGTNIRTQVHYLRLLLDALGHSQVILVGSSMGGWVTTRFTIEYPERVKHLYLINSAGLRREGIKSPRATDRASAKRALENIMGRALPIPAFILDAVVQNSQQPGILNFVQNYDRQEELDGVLEQVHVATTIIWGTRDHLLPITCAFDLHKGITNSRLLLVPGVGHSPHIQATGEVARIILKGKTEKLVTI